MFFTFVQMTVKHELQSLISGNYSTFENTRVMQEEQSQQQQAKSQQKIAHLQSFVLHILMQKIPNVKNIPKMKNIQKDQR